MAERLPQLISEQMALLDGVRDMLRNFRKDVTRRSEAHLEARLESLEAFHDEFRQNHRELVRTGHDDVVIKDYHYMDVFEKKAAWLSMVHHGDPNALKQFVQTCRASVTSLEKIGGDFQCHGQILVYYMTRKLSGQLRLEWEKSTAKRELPTFEDLCAYLDIQYRTMITASFYGSNPASTKERRNTSQSDKGTTVKSSFVTRDDCKQFAGMGVSDRMATVPEYRLCFICLDNKHQASKCVSRRYCERCTGRHHTLIHVEKEKRTVGPLKPSEESAQKVSTNLVIRSKEGSSTNGSNCDVLTPKGYR
ncbi:hypothetical protein ACLKA6_003184 [Drosophila palustris]